MVEVSVPYVVRIGNEDFEFDTANMLFKTTIGILLNSNEEFWPVGVKVLNVLEFSEVYIGISSEGFFFSSDKEDSKLEVLFREFLERENL